MKLTETYAINYAHVDSITSDIVSTITTITTSAYMQPACINCPSNPKNGGSGICGCILGQFKVT